MKKEKITFGAGCFWGVEEEFKKLKGVVDTTVGYMSASPEKSKKYPNPTYEQVCTDKTGFVEVCGIEYNPKKVSFEELLEVFWKIHNPTTKNRQGLDIGSQYKSVIFYYTPEQKKAAEKSLKKEQKKYMRKIKTEILPANNFCEAEEYHQDYLEKKGVKSCKV